MDEKRTGEKLYFVKEDGVSMSKMYTFLSVFKV